MKPFEIFSPGTHTPAAGKALSFSDDDVASIAAAYDPALAEAPIVIGHPTDKAPSWGWIKGLSFSEGRLVAEPDQVNADFAEMVKQGLFKKRSASFYRPDAPGNPKPGSYYLRHVAFLGAKPPSVKGLKDVEFGDAEDGVFTVDFADADLERQTSWVFGTLGRALQAMREFMISERGEEAADKAIPKYDVEEVMRAAGAAGERARSQSSPNFSEPPVKEDNVTDQTKAELEEQKRQLAEQKAKQDADAANFAERERKLDRADNEQALKALAAEGRLAPGAIPGMLDFMAGLDKTETVEFSEGDGTVKKTPRDYFLDLLKQSGKVIDFSEQAPGSKQPPARLSADPEEAAADLAREAVSFMEAEQAKGNTSITIDQAVAAVAKQKEAVS